MPEKLAEKLLDIEYADFMLAYNKGKDGYAVDSYSFIKGAKACFKELEPLIDVLKLMSADMVVAVDKNTTLDEHKLNCLNYMNLAKKVLKKIGVK